ncbi:hypothetical protein NE237_017098 [Protea cynaroides]|uniref:Uncharacterized protein n=1 Tax=Protea cynaroides TaxID=273540 RepID=A0A9Q0QMR0_9MAGN|nr:hypothetical protein NE237_017098 [Protea cynaroides]
MAMEPDMSSWTDLLHTSTKLLEQPALCAPFSFKETWIDWKLTKKLKGKTLRIEVLLNPLLKFYPIHCKFYWRRNNNEQRTDFHLYFAFSYINSRMTETPFRPRELLKEKQKYYQNIHKHTYLKGPFDKITSVAIPLALASTSLFLIGRGIYHMANGIGKKE